MKALTFLCYLFFLPLVGMAQISYSGNVLDAYDKKYLEGVTVTVLGKSSTQTNSRGYFSVKGMVGDTLQFALPGFFTREMILGQDRFFLVQIQDKARLLPTFQVEAEPYRFRFRDGKLYLAEDEASEEKSLSQQVTMGQGLGEGVGGIAIYGPISYFTRRNTQLRQYERRLEWLKRRQGYLEVIDSDSIRSELMAQYKLDRPQWDEIVIRFNEFHIQHEFLDWNRDRVINSLKEFLRIESLLEN